MGSVGITPTTLHRNYNNSLKLLNPLMTFQSSSGWNCYCYMIVQPPSKSGLIHPNIFVRLDQVNISMEFVYHNQNVTYQFTVSMTPRPSSSELSCHLVVCGSGRKLRSSCPPSKLNGGDDTVPYSRKPQGSLISVHHIGTMLALPQTTRLQLSLKL